MKKKVAPKLHAWQKNFSQAVQTKTKSIDGIADPRTQIYRGAYISRLRESLCEDFVNLSELAGKERLKLWAGDFVMRFSSREPNLADYSARFLRFLLRHPQVRAKWRQAARLDWANCLAGYTIDLKEAKELMADPAPIVRNPSLHWVEKTAVWRVGIDIFHRTLLGPERKLLQSMRTPCRIENLARRLARMGWSEKKTVATFKQLTRDGLIG